jgi:hypothetical protein
VPPFAGTTDLFCPTWRSEACVRFSPSQSRLLHAAPGRPVGSRCVVVGSASMVRLCPRFRNKQSCVLLNAGGQGLVSTTTVTREPARGHWAMREAMRRIIGGSVLSLCLLISGRE